MKKPIREHETTQNIRFLKDISKNFGRSNILGLSKVSVCKISQSKGTVLAELVVNMSGGKMVQYWRNSFDYKRNDGSNLNSLNNLNNAGGYGINSKQRKVITDRIIDWAQSVHHNKIYYYENNQWHKRQLGMLTVTLPSKQMHTDKELNRKLLMPLLEELKRKYKVINYYWKAESQENKNIHWHILIDRFIDKDEINKLCYKFMNDLGYMDKYYEQTNNTTYTGAKIEGLNYIHNIAGYVSKYITKQDKYRRMECRIYGMTNILKDIPRKIFYWTQEMSDLVDAYCCEKGFVNFHNDYVVSFNNNFRSIVFDNIDYIREGLKLCEWKLRQILYPPIKTTIT